MLYRASIYLPLTKKLVYKDFKTRKEADQKCRLMIQDLAETYQRFGVDPEYVAQFMSEARVGLTLVKERKQP